MRTAPGTKTKERIRMSWKYQPSETVWALVSDADTLYGGNVWFQTVERGDVYAV